MHEQALLIEGVDAVAVRSVQLVDDPDLMAHVVNDGKENRGGFGRQLHATTGGTVQTLGLLFRQNLQVGGKRVAVPAYLAQANAGGFQTPLQSPQGKLEPFKWPIQRKGEVFAGCHSSMADDGCFNLHVVGCRFWRSRRSATRQKLIDVDVKESAQP